MSKKKHKSKRSKKERYKIDYANNIIRVLKESNVPVSYSTLRKRCSGKDFNFKRFAICMKLLKKEGKICKVLDGFTLPGKVRFVKCEVVRLKKTYGFVRNLKTDEEIFVSGKYLLGAMPGDIVLVRPFKGSGSLIEGEIVEIEQENFLKFTGNIVIENGMYKVQPDSIFMYAIEFSNPLGIDFKENDKVLASITQRGKRHSEHKCELISSFGSSLKASSCAMSVLDLNGVTPVFPDEVISEARTVSDERKIRYEIKNRLDLRDMPVFTIDGADTKDIDDAISVVRKKDGFELGVHIADVSHYVKFKSALDKEAFKRGTSVYYANRVVPMLPKELSNGICSLNPHIDRLAFSCIMNIDENGITKGFNFKKTVIRSRVKGVYSEINEIISGGANNKIKEKYSEVMDTIPVMLELFTLLDRNKKARGCPNIETSESKLIIGENDECIGVESRTRGISEEIIEDFMLAANECAAKFGRENDLPFVYRVHEDPPEDKTERLFEGLTKLDIPFNSNGKVSARFLNDILTSTKETSKYIVVNMLVLRSMAKAKYSVEPIGHFGLVLNDYAHFTSPIRRYPDLTIHRIMSDYLENSNKSDIKSKYSNFAFASAERSTQQELVTMAVQRDCEDCYKAEYLSNHIGESFYGVIISVVEYGFYVELPNTCEGMVRIESLPEGDYDYDGYTELRNRLTGQSFKVGDVVSIKIANTNISSGKVQFELNG